MCNAMTVRTVIAMILIVISVMIRWFVAPLAMLTVITTLPTFDVFPSGDEGGVPISTECSLLRHPQRCQLHQHHPERLGRQCGLCCSSLCHRSLLEMWALFLFFKGPVPQNPLGCGRSPQVQPPGFGLKLKGVAQT